jgi:hypothetical protein
MPTFHIKVAERVTQIAHYFVEADNETTAIDLYESGDIDAESVELDHDSEIHTESVTCVPMSQLVPISVSKKLTLAECDAILRLSRSLGKRWKSIVRAAWDRGNCKVTGVSSEDSWAIQSVRNKLSSSQFAKLQRIDY